MTSGGEAAKHFLSGNYIRDPREKERAFGSRSGGQSENKSGGQSGNRSSGQSMHRSGGQSGNRTSSNQNRSQRTEETVTSKSQNRETNENLFDGLTLESINPEKIRRFVENVFIE